MKYALAVAWSYIVSWYCKVEYKLFQPPIRYFNGHERRKNPRTCTLCRGPMRPDRRPPRDARGHDGKIRRLPEEVLAWFQCGRCHQSQVGIPQ